MTVKTGDDDEASLGDNMETESFENDFYANETKRDSLAKSENLSTLEQLDTNLEKFSKCI